MLTRGVPVHQYTSAIPAAVNTPGAYVDRPVGAFNSRKNVVARMAIARPNSSPAPEGAPWYLGGSHGMVGMQRGGVGSFTPAKPRLEADPSDPTTWQRQYRFNG
jgi:hypothetical protein